MPKKPTIQPEPLDRQKVLADLFTILHADFECPDLIRDERFNPFDPAHVAHQAYTMIRSCYEELEMDEMDGLVDDLYDGYKGGDPDIENVKTVH